MTKRKDPKDLKPRGRPTKYKPSFCQEIIDFFDIEHAEWHDVVTQVGVKGSRVKGKAGSGYTRTERKLIANAPRYITQFARHIGIATSKLYEWEKKYPEFREALSRAREMAQEMISANAMRGLYDGRFTIFALPNMYPGNWRHKVTFEHDVTDETLEKLRAMSPEKLLDHAKTLIPGNRVAGYLPSEPGAKT